MTEKNNHSAIERIKKASGGLRGSIVESLRDEVTGAIREDDQAVIKFHGMYMQDDRDLREERAAQKLERLYSYMIRLRLPGGFLTSKQWIATHEVAGENSSGVIKITSRQTLQLHGIIKSVIKPTVQAFHRAKLDSIATCGDINRNVLCSSHPMQSGIHERVFSYADKISELLMPKTKAYYEIWLDSEKIEDKTDEVDPLYKLEYLPRKFKIAIVIPPNNDVDVFANDIGLIAIVENNDLAGFNIVVGGSLSATHGNPETYPRIGTIIGFCNSEEKTLKTVYEILAVQRDFGNRSDRKLARLKYTIDRMGVEVFKDELERRIGFKLDPPRPYHLTERADYYGWHKSARNLWYYTVFVENGRILDEGNLKLKSALLEIAKTDKANFRFTCSQNVILSDIKWVDTSLVQEILERFGVVYNNENTSRLRKNSMACVALNTCPLALAEGQRYLPSLISMIEPLLQAHNLQHEEIVIRMTGCPNGCARPSLAEIGLIGTAYGRYNLHLGGDHSGTRLNFMFRENLDERSILDTVDQLFSEFKKGRKNRESFGDFTWRVCKN